MLSLFDSCRVYKTSLIERGDCKAAMTNAILDFTNTRGKAFCQYNVFSVRCEYENDSTILVHFYGYRPWGLTYITFEQFSDTTLFNAFYEYKKLFIWNDEQLPENPVLLQKLYDYDMIGKEWHLDIHDKNLFVTYRFCRDNLKKYVKLKSSKNSKTQLHCEGL